MMLVLFIVVINCLARMAACLFLAFVGTPPMTILIATGIVEAGHRPCPTTLFVARSGSIRATD